LVAEFKEGSAILEGTLDALLAVAEAATKPLEAHTTSSVDDELISHFLRCSVTASEGAAATPYSTHYYSNELVAFKAGSMNSVTLSYEATKQEIQAVIENKLSYLRELKWQK